MIAISTAHMLAGDPCLVIDNSYVVYSIAARYVITDGDNSIVTDDVANVSRFIADLAVNGNHRLIHYGEPVRLFHKKPRYKIDRKCAYTLGPEVISSHVNNERLLWNAKREVCALYTSRRHEPMFYPMSHLALWLLSGSFSVPTVSPECMLGNTDLFRRYRCVNDNPPVGRDASYDCQWRGVRFLINDRYVMFSSTDPAIWANVYDRVTRKTYTTFTPVKTRNAIIRHEYSKLSYLMCTPVSEIREQELTTVHVVEEAYENGNLQPYALYYPDGRFLSCVALEPVPYKDTNEAGSVITIEWRAHGHSIVKISNDIHDFFYDRVNSKEMAVTKLDTGKYVQLPVMDVVECMLSDTPTVNIEKSCVAASGFNKKLYDAYVTTFKADNGATLRNTISLVKDYKQIKNPSYDVHGVFYALFGTGVTNFGPYADRFHITLSYEHYMGDAIVLSVHLFSGCNKAYLMPDNSTIFSLADGTLFKVSKGKWQNQLWKLAVPDVTREDFKYVCKRIPKLPELGEPISIRRRLFDGMPTKAAALYAGAEAFDMF